MAPLINETDFDLSGHEDAFFDAKMYMSTPLHETATAQTLVQNNNNKSNKRKRVSFGEMVLCHDVMGLDYYTEEERRACWFTADDMACMKQNIRAEARLVDRGLLREDGLEYTTTIRGLEHKTREGQRLRKEKRLEAYAAVFSEIEFQKEESFSDDELIADAYFAYSDACALAAATIGAQDAIAAKIIYREDAARERAAARQQQRERKQQQQKRQQKATQKPKRVRRSKPSIFRKHRSC